MAVNFTALEILEIAEQIEQNGAKFYRDAAVVAGNRSIRQFFLTLAGMEDKHKKIFADMAKNIQDAAGEAKVFDPDNETVYYLKAIAKSAGWEGKASLYAEFAGSETLEQILKRAIEAEKASINYYVGLKDFVASQEDKNKVNAIIKEEMGHVVTLQKHLEELNN